MDKKMRGRAITGLLLIALGLGLWGLRLTDEVGRRVILFALGGFFLGGYLYTRVYGQVVAGCVLLGLGVGMLGEQYSWLWGEFSRLGLGLGFLLLYALPLAYERRSRWWPLIPGSVLILLGMGRWHRAWTYLLGDGWPLLIVIAGVVILIGSLVGRRPKKRT